MNKYILQKGWGYWDVTRYPYGGDFKRAKEEMPVEIIGEGTKPDEKKIQFADGRIGFCQERALTCAK